MTDEEALRRLYSHLVKRVFDEYGIEIGREWEQRVLGGEHDVPLPSHPPLVIPSRRGRYWLMIGIIAIGCGGAAAWVVVHRPPPCPIEPLKVTVLDDGGADLQVSSSVNCR